MLSKFKALKEESGQSMVLFALLFAVICGFAAFAIDFGSVALEKSHLQNAIDAATLAGAQELPNTAKATAAVNQYIQLNGYEPSDISVSYSDSNNTISVQGAKEVTYTFSRLLGLSGTTVYPTAVAMKTSAGAAFDYAIFSGNKSAVLALTGSVIYIGGNAHSNYQFSMTGSSQTITGSGEAVSRFSITGSGITIGGSCEGSSITSCGSNIQIGSKVYTPAPVIEMPDFSEVIKAQAQAAGQAYTGNKTFVGNATNVDSPIYVDGNVTICGGSFTGNGCILATGNITFTGNGLNYKTGDSVCFYSQNGSIYITGTGAVVEGILYAPKGTIAITGSNARINGRIVADRLQFTGSNISIIGGENDLKSLSAGAVKLTD